jgi:hypothetical protein
MTPTNCPPTNVLIFATIVRGTVTLARVGTSRFPKLGSSWPEGRVQIMVKWASAEVVEVVLETAVCGKGPPLVARWPPAVLEALTES